MYEYMYLEAQYGVEVPSYLINVDHCSSHTRVCGTSYNTPHMYSAVGKIVWQHP